MSILRRRFTGLEQRSTQPPAIPSNAEFAAVTPGVTVTADSAMTLSAWWACVNLIADVVSTFPVHTFRDTGGGGVAERAPDPTLVSAPSDRVSPVAWRRQVVVSWLARGNAWGWVTAVDAVGRPAKIEILDPDWVSVDPPERGVGSLTYRVLGERVELAPVGRLWHVPGYVAPGWPIGLSPVAYAAESIGLGIAAQRFGARWFGKGAHPSAVLSTDQALTADQADAMKQRFKAAVQQGDVAALGAGIQYKPIQIAPEESQFLETTRANVATIARFFRVPPEMIGGEAGGSLTYANVEQRAIDFLTFTLAPWVVKLEEALTALTSRSTYVRLNVDGLLRSDAKTRAEVLDMKLRSGAWSRDEVRAKDNLPPGAGGDVFNWPPYSVSPGPTGGGTS